MNKLLLQGICDACGFVAGALLGMVAARLFGLDPFSQETGSSSIVGIMICGLGGGAGVQLARRFILPMLEKHLGSK